MLNLVALTHFQFSRRAPQLLNSFSRTAWSVRFVA